MLDGVYRDGAPTSVEVGAPTDDELHALLQKIITKLMKLLSRRGVLEEDMGQTYLAEPDAESDEARMLRSLQAAAVTLQAAPGQWPGPSPGTNSPLDCLCPGSAYRIAFGPRAGQKMLTLRGAMPREDWARQPLCADIDGFSLHAAVRVEAHDRKRLEQLCRYITRPALSDERVQLNATGQVELKLKTPWRDGTTHLVMSPLEFMQRLAVLGPRPRLHLIRFGVRITSRFEVSGLSLREHGVLAPNAKLRSQVVPRGPEQEEPVTEAALTNGQTEHAQAQPRRISGSRLLKRVLAAT